VAVLFDRLTRLTAELHRALEGATLDGIVNLG